MRLARVQTENGIQLAISTGEGAIMLNRHIPELGSDMLKLIQDWDNWSAHIREILEEGHAPEPVATGNWLRPLDRPGKILAIGLNYADHIAETGMSRPDRQLWFNKLPNTANDPYNTIPLPRAGSQVDYEVELVAVIAKPCRHLDAAQARDHVFGYCVGNDVSVRDWQRASPQWTLGKSFDGHAPFGPWITLDSAVENPHALDIQCRVNGDVRQKSNTRHLVYSIWDQIAHLSQVLTLEPGDLIFTGTPGGVGVAMEPPRFLAQGDIVRCEISELGHIENCCEPEGAGDGPGT
ncbi:fumarylacetoacetate hydrolase family protein [Henriciella aquimarina]|uniref:fumarylacetoacetate hydrolase family protein n=1 Tax=Henriciella aquimarina TaxID=545261 RepID=UPI0009FE0F72|nr:fumarylacetoacetate hydrolase family protein [Henriciella aquimarina]